MRISTKYNFSFLCMPKCESTSIEKMLDPYSQLKTGIGNTGLKHTRFRGYEKYIKPFIKKNDIETVCLMREPISWLNSWYRNRCRQKLANPKNYCGNLTFQDWIEEYLSENRTSRTNIGMQSDFLKDKNGNIGLDRIFKYENVAVVKEYFSDKTGKKLNLPKLNISPKIDYHLEPETEKRLRKKLQIDYSIYNSLDERGCTDNFKKVDFVIAGTQKGGTTSLDKYIRHHPEICMPVNKKELHFFDNKKYFDNNHNSIDNYNWYHSNFFPAFRHKIFGESTPKYMYDTNAIENIHRYNPSMKFIILLRNPAERAYSHWNMIKKRGNENRSFSDAIESEMTEINDAIPKEEKKYTYIDRGFYSRQIKQILSLFPRENICVIKSSELKTNQSNSLRKIYNFLEIFPMTEKVSNKTFHRGNYSDQISDKERKILLELYKDDILELEKILDMDFSEWYKV